MYYQYFGLAEAPFSIAVNPRYLYMSPRHRDALAHLLYGVGAGGGFILLTGEVGTGKTTINRCLLEQLPDNADIAIILNPALDARDLLATVCDELGIEFSEADPGLKQLTDSLHRFLLDNHAAQRKTVLMIDEAQHLGFSVLEQIRLLTNLETKDEKLLHIILIGQPELAAKLARPELRQLNQRITARFDLRPLSLAETGAYIRHRLHVAGLPGGTELFPPKLIRAVHRRSRGIPRLINLLCDRMMLGAYGRNSVRLDRKLLTEAALEVLGPTEGLRRRPSGVQLAIAMGVCVAILLCVWLLIPPLTRTTPDALFREVETGIEPATVGGSLVERGGAQDSESLPGRAPAEPASTESDQDGEPLEPIDEALSAVPPQQADNSASPDSDDAVVSDSTWRLSPEQGAALLASVYEQPWPSSTRDLCAVSWSREIRCERRRVDSWNQLMEEPRPALLSLIDSRRLESRALFLGIENDAAILGTANGLARVALAELAPQWTGDYWRLWRSSISLRRVLKPGDQGPDVREFAALFAEIDGQEEPLSQGRFNDRLATRLRLFQEQAGLEADGILGAQTLRALLLAAGRDVDFLGARRLLSRRDGAIAGDDV